MLLHLFNLNPHKSASLNNYTPTRKSEAVINYNLHIHLDMYDIYYEVLGGLGLHNFLHWLLVKVDFSIHIFGIANLLHMGPLLESSPMSSLPPKHASYFSVVSLTSSRVFLLFISTFTCITTRNKYSIEEYLKGLAPSLSFSLLLVSPTI